MYSIARQHLLARDARPRQRLCVQKVNRTRVFLPRNEPRAQQHKLYHRCEQYILEHIRIVVGRFREVERIKAQHPQQVGRKAFEHVVYHAALRRERRIYRHKYRHHAGDAYSPYYKRFYVTF
jgi:hypothetical protein